MLTGEGQHMYISILILAIPQMRSLAVRLKEILDCTVAQILPMVTWSIVKTEDG